jgi:hypothetical protein
VANETDDYDLPELLYRSDLSARSRRAVYDTIVSSMLDGDIPSRESVLRLIEFAAGRIDIDQYKQQVLDGLNHDATTPPGNTNTDLDCEP